MYALFVSGRYLHDGYSWCRHCALGAKMTAEQLPAHAADNSGPGSEVAWNGEPSAEPLQAWPDGFVAETLCDPCNNNGSRWKMIDEYVAWRNEAIASLQRYCVDAERPAPCRLVPGEPIPLTLNYDRMPGRFARYVVGMFLAAQRNELLHADYPHLLDATTETGRGGPPAGCDIAPVRLFVAFANQDTILSCDRSWGFPVGVPGRSASGLYLPAPTTKGMTEFRTFVMSPFAFTLVTSGPDLPGSGLDISTSTQLGHHERLPKRKLTFELPAFGIEGLAPAPAN